MGILTKTSLHLNTSAFKINFKCFLLIFAISHTALIAFLALIRICNFHSYLFGLFSDERNAGRITAIIQREIYLSEITEESIHYLIFFLYILLNTKNYAKTFTICAGEESDTSNYI